MTMNDLLVLQPSPESMGTGFRTVLDPNEVETFGQEATSGLACALGFQSLHLWRLPGMEEPLPKVAG